MSHSPHASVSAFIIQHIRSQNCIFAVTGLDSDVSFLRGRSSDIRGEMCWSVRC